MEQPKFKVAQFTISHPKVNSSLLASIDEEVMPWLNDPLNENYSVVSTIETKIQNRGYELGHGIEIYWTFILERNNKKLSESQSTSLVNLQSWIETGKDLFRRKNKNKKEFEKTIFAKTNQKGYYSKNNIT